MKTLNKQILSIGTVVLIAFVSATFIGFGNAINNESEHTEHMDNEAHVRYQCPMKCEEEKM